MTSKQPKNLMSSARSFLSGTFFWLIAAIGFLCRLLLIMARPQTLHRQRLSQSYLNAIALRLNQRPRKTLGFETPADRLQAVLR
jgi:hypothetical protein